MKRPTLALFFTAVSLAFACSCKSSESNGSERPFRDTWRVEYEGPFRVIGDDGEPFIRRLTIGNSLGFQDNFVNRGDVIVRYDGAPNTIKIEFRKFTSANSEAGAQDVYDHLDLWAYALGGNPQPPQGLDEADRCDVSPGGWQDNCSIQVYYKGQTQLQRAGADIRVTLPPDYRQKLEIRTADNLGEASYPNRGNVCVEGLNGSVDIQMQSGEAFVSLARDITPSPECSIVDNGSLLADCEAKAWDASCACITQNRDFGQVKIRSLEPSPGSMTVDAPADLWATFNLDNTAMDATACRAVIDGMNNVEYTVQDPAQPWRLRGETNHPMSAPAGAGFALDLESTGCGEVPAVESPEAWNPDQEPDAELQGITTLCAGCLQGKSCESLLPDD